MQPGHMAYDRAITVFSPDGRLFQVEYAREAVKRGTTTVGLKFKDGVVLIVDKRIGSKLFESESIPKIYKIDKHIGCATSGLVADARVLVDRARVEAQINKVTYEENIGVETVVKKICDFKQSYTQYGGVRPFGVAFLIGGVDEKGSQLFEIDPSSAFFSWKAQAIGKGSVEAVKVLKKGWKANLSKEDAIKVAIQALKIGEKGVKPNEIELAIVTDKFEKYFGDEGTKFIKKYW